MDYRTRTFVEERIPVSLFEVRNWKRFPIILAYRRAVVGIFLDLVRARNLLSCKCLSFDSVSKSDEIFKFLLSVVPP